MRIGEFFSALDAAVAPKEATVRRLEARRGIHRPVGRLNVPWRRHGRSQKPGPQLADVHSHEVLNPLGENCAQRDAMRAGHPREGVGGRVQLHEGGDVGLDLKRPWRRPVRHEDALVVPRLLRVEADGAEQHREQAAIKVRLLGHRLPPAEAPHPKLQEGRHHLPPPPDVQIGHATVPHLALVRPAELVGGAALHHDAEAPQEEDIQRAKHRLCQGRMPPGAGLEPGEDGALNEGDEGQALDTDGASEVHSRPSRAHDCRAAAKRRSRSGGNAIVRT